MRLGLGSLTALSNGSITALQDDALGLGRKNLACAYERLWGAVFAGPDSARMQCGRFVT